MAAEQEKVIGGAHSRDTEQCCDQLTQRDLVRGGGRHIIGAQAGPFGCRQRAAIELAVRRQRKRVEHDKRRRQHVVGQVRGKTLPQGAEIERRLVGTAPMRYDIGDEARAAVRVLVRDHRRLGNRGIAQHGSLDLAGLDPETANLDLLVGAAVEGQGAVAVPCGEVAGAIDPLPRFECERVRDEAFRGQAGTAPVAARQAGASNVQLADDSRRTRLQRRVEHVDASVGDWRPDRRTVGIHGGAAPRDRAPDGRLCRSVLVEQVDAGKDLAMGPDRL